MVEPRKRSRSAKKVKRRTPGGGTATHFRGKKHGKPVCGRCGKKLSGVASDRPSQVRNLTKGGKLPARPYAGTLCSDCLDSLVRYVTRMEVKHSVPEYGDLQVERDLTLEKYLPRGWWGEVSSGKVRKSKPKSRPKKKAKKKSE